MNQSDEHSRDGGLDIRDKVTGGGGGGGGGGHAGSVSPRHAMHVLLRRLLSSAYNCDTSHIFVLTPYWTLHATG